MLISRLPSGGGKGELHGASILVTVEDDGLIGQTVELYFGSELFKDGVISGEKSCLFTNILEIGTYTAKIGELESTAEVTGDNIVKLETVTIPVSSGIELTIGNTYSFDGYDWTCSANGGSYWVLSRSGVADYNLVKVNYRLEGYNDIVAIDAPERLYLYDLGDECVDVTGGFDYGFRANPSYGQIIRNSDNIELFLNHTSGSYRAYMENVTPIDNANNYKTIGIQYSVTISPSNLALVASPKQNWITTAIPIVQVALPVTSEKTEIRQDISGVASWSYISVFNNVAQTRNKIYKIWLEK